MRTVLMLMFYADVLDVPAVPNNGTKGRLDHILVNPPARVSPAPPAEPTTASCSYPATSEDREKKRNVSDCSCPEWQVRFTGLVVLVGTRVV